ncbi:MAG: hypothetical protein UR28_C0003G0088 [Candidatus Peregrinibacteria bacterium GW2011_GWF2_33_10]|nr:MAG: hypothetical protein UR28_C0003G0088 [Candidatus Peregrinibacteria bacterium GW2011_GWF2_33_10]OGJ44237.1 MAG: hypothetical protein A2263_04655 [Candidatus Peregrinibacteria bacterium RIFOXYA2_FULL_33_21]OGJ47196.1 MAG: hypothetical protein A2272_06325 [Candidatus Peregrinibacteria bacterium RIFOXYA12_FULL_33_12]OGJ49948.1 MAG: hypothetical protein A2307_00830 [Candidatus Peregrinibacteria bacterium RIFOXYB2_FULL_33_20]
MRTYRNYIILTIITLSIVLVLPVLNLQKTKINEEALAQASTNIPNPTCLDNYNTWKTSTTFKNNAPWSTALFSYNPVSAQSTSSFSPYYTDFNIDLNGDGLPDYIYVYHQLSQPNYIGMNDCVMLNNGTGWTVAYKCVSSYDTATSLTKYYGDCAL